VICILRAAIGVAERLRFCERRRLQIDDRPSVITSIATLNGGHDWQEIQWFTHGPALYVSPRESQERADAQKLLREVWIYCTRQEPGRYRIPGIRPGLAYGTGNPNPEPLHMRLKG
jgi:hypothetical protein